MIPIESEVIFLNPGENDLKPHMERPIGNKFKGKKGSQTSMDSATTGLTGLTGVSGLSGMEGVKALLKKRKG